MSTFPLTEVEATLPSVAEYLRTTYSPDCDYVEGIIEERNLGEYEHSRLQIKLGALFLNHEKEWGVISVPECRLQVAHNRFRVPDVMVLRQSQKVAHVVREAPLLCIEVLSPEDSWAKMRSRLNDYLALGVEHLWCFDPEAREVRRYTPEGFNVVNEPELTIAGTPIRIVSAEVFAILDEPSK